MMIPHCALSVTTREGAEGASGDSGSVFDVIVFYGIGRNDMGIQNEEVVR